MSLLNIFRSTPKASTSSSARKAALRRSPMLDCLEKREVFTAGLAGAFVGPMPMVSQPAAVSAPAVAQSGTSLGLAWRFAPAATGGGGTLFVQDVAKGTNSADPKNEPIAVNVSGTRMIFDTDIASPSYGPTIKAGSQVKVVVAETTGDIQVYDDRNAGTGGLTTEPRHETGTISVPYGSLSWTFDQNIVTQTGTFKVASGANDHSTYWITTQHQDLSPGDPGYDPHNNPVVGLQVTDSGSDSGGVSFDPGMDITVSHSGGATFKTASV
jgi:hypothetical protein